VIHRNRVTLEQRALMAEELGIKTALALQGAAANLAPLEGADATNPQKVLEHQVATMIIGLYPQAQAAISTPGLLSHATLVRTFLTLLEFKLPKLARVEQTGTVNHNHAVRTFVEVEKREEPPTEMREMEPGVYAVAGV
jgi:hypothetical protein